MKLKTKLDYVDEFRKISILQKLPQLPKDGNYLFNISKKQQNNKFIRQKQEPKLNEAQLNQSAQILLKNHIVQDHIQDSQKIVRNQYQNTNKELNEQIVYYNDISRKIGTQIKTKQYEYKFYFQHSSPPSAIAPESLDFNALQIQLKAVSDQDEILKNEQNKPLNLPKQKYNFFKINQKRLQKDEEIEVNKNQLKIEALKSHEEYITKYDRKHLRDIKNINQQLIGVEDFSYNFQIKPNTQLNKILNSNFIVNSVIQESLVLKVQYLRDIGLPSRNIWQYANKKLENRQISKIKQNMLGFMGNVIEQAKSQTKYLQLLRPQQLNIDKEEVNFFDMINISTGRITSDNSHLCIKSDKVTRAEFEKASKKLQKFQKIQKEQGKATVNAETQTIQQINRQITVKNPNALSKMMLVDEIIEVNREWKVITQDQQKKKFINASSFQLELKNRMTQLLNNLYNLAAKQYHIPYTIDQAMQNFTYLQNISQQKGDIQLMRLIWFIADNYYLICKAKIEDDNLVSLAKVKGKKEPLRTKYKDLRTIAVQKINTSEIYTAKHLQRKTQRSKSPIPIIESIRKTPQKLIGHLTPTKQSALKNSHTPQKKTTKKQPTNVNVKLYK